MCPHVNLKTDKESKPKSVTILSGPCRPEFSWDPKRMADIPRLRCVQCDKWVNILGYIVHQKERRIVQREVNVQTKRERTCKQDKKKPGSETFTFVDS